MELMIFLGSIGPWSYVLIGAAILLLFGGQKIPELMRGLGSGIKEFKDATRDENASSEVDKNSTNSANGESNPR